MINLHISNHNAIYCCVNSVVNAHHSAHLNGKFLSFRFIKSLNVAQLKADLASAPWCSLECIDNLDDKLAMFNSLFMDIWNCHVPIKHHLARMKSTPWMTDKVLDATHIRNFVYKRYIASYTQTNVIS